MNIKLLIGAVIAGIPFGSIFKQFGLGMQICGLVIQIIGFLIVLWCFAKAVKSYLYTKK